MAPHPQNTAPARLVFDPAHRPEGFTSGNLAGFDGSPEPIVREILQNALDAAEAVGRPARAAFAIRQVDAADIPDMDGYRSAFEAAHRERRHSEVSHDERTAIGRIQRALNGGQIVVLTCRDNGVGLDPRRMDALLTSGNTSKGAGGAGSYGLGHHAAFAASDLRYVLYGAQYQHNGARQQIASGHAILATRTDHSRRQRLAADGYLRDRHPAAGQQPRLPFDGTGNEYPRRIPPLFAEMMPDDSEGSVVCVAGFNDFHRDSNDSDTVEAICRAAAANFLVAIMRKGMTVDVADNRSGQTSRLDVETIGALLEAYSETSKRAARSGHISGRAALGAYRTLREGEPVPTKIEGAELWLRRLTGDDRAVTRVHVFRRGMWITNTAPGLQSAKFGEALPFEAVVALEAGPLERLVRDAEGPSHLGIQPRRLSPADRKHLRTLTAEVAESLRAKAGARNSTEDFVPSGFAQLGGYQVRAAERLHRRRSPMGGGSRPSSEPAGTEKARKRGRGHRSKGRPRPGTRPDYRSVIRPDSDACHVEARVDYREQATKGEMVGVRLRYLSGSDATCDTPLPDDHLPIKAALLADNADNEVIGVAHDDWEVHFPAPTAGPVTLALELSEPVPEIELVEVDVVRRRAADAATQQPAEP